MPASINGIGTLYYGECDFHPDGSYVTTEWLSVVYLPVLPFRSIRLMRLPHLDRELIVFSSQGFLNVQRIPLHWRQVLNVYGFLGFVALSWTVILVAPDLFGSSWGHVPFEWIFLTLFPLLGGPFLLPIFLRWRARRKVPLSREALQATINKLKESRSLA
ncbi:MAG: hypothetical protein NTY98_24070 [Verrucomicrobia bacterium]|nr:hypothetical protein [Verrucomicrobiota bacterium]